MFIHLTGEKERRSSNHVVYVAPGAVEKRENCPSDWFELDGNPKQFSLVFIHGRASVDQQLGEWNTDEAGSTHQSDPTRQRCATRLARERDLWSLTCCAGIVRPAVTSGDGGALRRVAPNWVVAQR